LRPLVGKFISKVTLATKRATKHLGPLIEHRLQMEEDYGKDWPDKPNDLISWLLDTAEGEQRKVPELIQRVNLVNFAAIHTSSMTFTHALFDLAANPQYLEPLRQEVEEVVKKEGWTKAAIGQMRKVDSFLKESQRMNGIGSTIMNRMVVKDFTFSDGTVLPKGTFINVPTYAIHHDEANYSHPNEFDGFRFSNMRGGEGEGTKHQMIQPSDEYLPFGQGRHACPGRFFAVNELKAMLAWMVVTYDVKLEGDSRERPANTWFTTRCLPSSGKVLFRKRQV